jgi:hypothetical protein
MNKKCHSRTRFNTTLWSVVCMLALSNVSMGKEQLEAGQDQAQGHLLSALGDEDKDKNNTSSATENSASALPSLDEMVKVKLDALNAKLVEQDEVLAKVAFALAGEQSLEKQTFDDTAYLSMAIFNSAPPADYKLLSTEVFIDDTTKPVSRGGDRNQGLPRNNEQIFFAPLTPGCHEVVVKAKFVRLKNDLISRFVGVKREQIIERRQVIMAKSGYLIELDIETFESQNSFIKIFRNPEIRFNRLVRPNFLPGAPLVSLDKVLNQGQVRIDYINGDESQHKLIDKSLSIDGLPILTNKSHDGINENNIVFQAPLAEGRHRLNVTLVFGEKTWISGGPVYNLRLSFEREFFVASGHTTLVNLVGMPKNGFRSDSRDSRYARVSSKISSEQEAEFFPLKTCQELQAEEIARQKALPVIPKELEEPQAPVSSPPTNGPQQPEKAEPEVLGE